MLVVIYKVAEDRQLLEMIRTELSKITNLRFSIAFQLSLKMVRYISLYKRDERYMLFELQEHMPATIEDYFV